MLRWQKSTKTRVYYNLEGARIAIISRGILSISLPPSILARTGGLFMASKKFRNANFKSFESRTKNSRYVRITVDMMKSLAWQELDTYDMVAYLCFKSEYYERNNKTDNQKDLSLTYDNMKKAMSPDRFRKCVDNLIRVGLIDIIIHKPQTRDATIYGLSDRWHAYGTSEFKEKERVKFNRRKG